MNAKRQALFYSKVGVYLTKAAERKKLSYSAIATLSGEQFNTIKNALEGGRCSIHQAMWIKNILEVDLNELINFASQIEGSHVEESNEEESREESREDSVLDCLI